LRFELRLQRIDERLAAQETDALSCLGRAVLDVGYDRIATGDAPERFRGDRARDVV
jgi:hypothetical protein